MKQRFVIECVSFTFVVALAGAARATQSCTTETVSVDSNGVAPNAGSSSSRISGNGQFVVFFSDATNLVTGDFNVARDVFVHDRVSGATKIASVATSGAQANQGAGDNGCDVSDDGRYVVFSTASSNLVGSDTNGQSDVFVRDMVANTTQRVSVGLGAVQADNGAFGSRISGDGSYIAFNSNATVFDPADLGHVYDVVRMNRTTGVHDLVSRTFAGTAPNDGSSLACISSDGRFVGFNSSATDLVPGSDTNGAQDSFVRDMVNGTTKRVSLGNAGAAPTSHSWMYSISDDGRYATFLTSGLGGGVRAYVRDLVNSTTETVAIPLDGSAPNGGEVYPSVSRDGRFVAFYSSATNLVLGDTNGNFDVFVFDRVTRLTRRISVSNAGQQAFASSGVGEPTFAIGATSVTFESTANNIAPGANGQQNVFVRDCDFGAPQTYCTAKTNSNNCVPSIGFTGSRSASAGSGFTITATNMLNNKAGLLFYGLNGPQAVSFQGGSLCVTPPTRRTPIQLSGGNAAPANDCSGAFAFDFNAYIATGFDPALVHEQPVWAQYWSRDPASPSTTNLTDAVGFVIDL